MRIEKRGAWTKNEVPLDARLRWVDQEIGKLAVYPRLRKEKTPAFPHELPAEKQYSSHPAQDLLAGSSRPQKARKPFLPFIILLLGIGGICALILLSQFHQSGIFSGTTEATGGFFSSFFRSFVSGNAITGAALGVQPVEDEVPVSLRIAVGNLTAEQGQPLHVTAWVTLSGTMAFAADREVTLLFEEKEIARETTDEEGKAVFAVDTAALVPGAYTLVVTAAEARDWALITIVAANTSGEASGTEPVTEEAAPETTSPSPLTGSVVIQPLPEAEVVEPAANTSEPADRKSTRLNSSHSSISYAVFCLKKKNHIYNILQLNKTARMNGKTGTA